MLLRLFSQFIVKQFNLFFKLETLKTKRNAACRVDKHVTLRNPFLSITNTKC